MTEPNASMVPDWAAEQTSIRWVNKAWGNAPNGLHTMFCTAIRLLSHPALNGTIHSSPIVPKET